MKSVVKRRICIVLAGALGIIAALIITCTFHIMQVQGDTMKPAIKDNGFVLINKLAYLNDQPKEGDVVAFPCNVYSEDGEGSILVKRVVATQGDTVEIQEGALYINGQPYDKYAKEAVYMEPMEKTTVGKGCIFVLSDNRQAVLDSRNDAVGQLTDRELIGKVCFK